MSARILRMAARASLDTRAAEAKVVRLERSVRWRVWWWRRKRALWRLVGRG